MSTTTSPATLAGVWCVDTTRSSVGFSIRHLGVATVQGRFDSLAGRVQLDSDSAALEGWVDVASVDTGNAIRDRRLRDEFFGADTFPAMTFRADVLAPTLRGELTIRDVTRPVTLAVRSRQLEDGSVRLSLEGKIRRSEFGLEWDALRTAGRLIVADHVRLVADLVIERR